jgi:fructoselysine-6-P-deglycase FrlB-like protein
MILNMANSNTQTSNSLKAMKLEIESQLMLPDNLDLPRQVDLSRCAMTGSGDSYIVASIASYLSKFRITCCYPSTLILNPEILNDKELYIISVSGRTAHNIAAAKVAIKNNIKTFAVTADPESELGKVCDGIVRIEYSRRRALTSGTASFFLSMLTCLSLMTKITYNRKDLKLAFEIANNRIDDLLKEIPSTTSSILFLADGILYPVACYASLKLNEVLGIRSYPYSLEEYCHAPLFSMKKDDKIIILKGYENNIGQSMIINNFVRKLGGLNYSLSSLDFPGSSYLECLFQAIFSVQLLSLNMAQKNGLVDCFFVQNHDLLGVSSGCIY